MQRAYAIERARAAGVAGVHVVEWRRKEEMRAQYDERLLEAVRSERPDLVLLLGWMHLLSDAFVAAFPEMLNLHPAFLPLDPSCDDVGLPDGTRIAAFRGPRAVHDALAAGSRWVGATVHRVTPATDRGPVLARKPLRVEAGRRRGVRDGAPARRGASTGQSGDYALAFRAPSVGAAARNSPSPFQLSLTWVIILWTC